MRVRKTGDSMPITARVDVSAGNLKSKEASAFEGCVGGRIRYSMPIMSS